MRPPRRAPRAAGFTLIELMVVMAVIALLTSMALPMFRTFSLRAKTSGRDMMTRAMYLAITDQYRSNERFANLSGTISYTWAMPNPTQPSNGNKHLFDKTVSGWSQLAFAPEGALYGQYEVFALTQPGLTYVYLHTTMDLDGNGLSRDIYTYYQLDTDGSWYEWLKVDPRPTEW